MDVCLQRGNNIPIMQDEINDRFILVMKLSKAEREWKSLTDRIYDEPNRDNIEAMAKCASDLLLEIGKLNEQIDNMVR